MRCWSILGCSGLLQRLSRKSMECKWERWCVHTLSGREKGGRRVGKGGNWLQIWWVYLMICIFIPVFLCSTNTTTNKRNVWEEVSCKLLNVYTMYIHCIYNVYTSPGLLLHDTKCIYITPPTPSWYYMILNVY